MTPRRVLLTIASFALAALLILLLIRVGKIDVRLTLRQLQSVSPFAFAKLVLLNFVLVFLSTEKWRSVDAALRLPSDSVPPRANSFALTSIGMVLGLVLPVQVGMTVARTLGTYFHGRPLQRGTAGTLLEQSFDVLTASFLAIASAATLLFNGGALMWIALAIGMVAIALLAAQPLTALVRRFAAYCAPKETPQTWFAAALGNFSELRNSDLLSAGLARRLLTLSAIRFAVVVLMAAQTADAIGVRIPLWQMAAAIPFVIVVMVIGVTPGGVGVNELTSVTALKLFGTPLQVAAQWALANRLLVTASCFVVAACAAIVLAAEKLGAPNARMNGAGKTEEIREC